MPMEEPELTVLLKTFPISLVPTEWQQTISSDGRAEKRRITVRASRAKRNLGQTQILLSTGLDLADLPITIEIVPLSEPAAKMGVLWYEPPLKSADGVVNEPDRVFGAFGLPNSLFNDLWVRVRSNPGPLVHLYISAHPLDSSGMLKIQWNVVENKSLTITDVEFAFVRPGADASPIPEAIADFTQRLDNICDLLSSIVKQQEHNPLERKIGSVFALLLMAGLLIFAEYESRKVSNIWGQLTLWTIAIGVWIYCWHRFEKD